jgi:glycosyltransferase involved in cell wall biosynthesis
VDTIHKTKEDTVLVSIVMATYNGEKYIAEQLDSIFNQSYKNIEVIVADDCSTDNTLNILSEYAARNHNLKIFVNEKNLGYIKNFEKCCQISQGKYIALCDQDDIWHTDKIKLMVASIGNHSMAYCDSYICKDDIEKTGKKISDLANFRSRYNCLENSVFCRMYGNALLFDRSLLEKALPFPKSVPHDWWLAYLATLSNGIKYVDAPLVFYRQHSSNLIGAVGGNMKKKEKDIDKREKKRKEISEIRNRMNAFYNACPDSNIEDKKVLRLLNKSYRSFSLYNNFLRMVTFFRYQDILLFVKKRSLIRKWLFCFKTFVIIK